ncbi:MAG: hypothetical protein Q8P76_02205 [bacterium]|nr:hypothetical protein [bacterium]
MKAWVYVVLALGGIAALICLWLLMREAGYWLGIQVGEVLIELTEIIYTDPLSGM